MSLIGRLEEHLSLLNILQRLESFAKTGLLVVKQDQQWVELYFRDGRLMCIGPVRTKSTLGERLLQAGLITPHALAEVMLSLGVSDPSETRMAITLMDFGFVTHEGLRAWASKQATEVIQVLLTWQTGEIYFEDEVATPPDRLLVSLAISSLLPVTPMQQRPASSSAPMTDQVQPNLPPASPVNMNVTKYLDAADLLTETPQNIPSFVSPNVQFTDLNIADKAPINSSANAQVPNIQPTRVINPTTPRRIDISFMRPEMVLIPIDLSALRESNPQVQITPEQWRLMTRVDGQTTLLAASQELAMSPEMVCQVAGELMALGLIYVAQLQPANVNELSPVSRDFITSGISNGLVGPGYAAAPPQPWVAMTPTTEGLRLFSQKSQIETQSQWGNGGNGATFVPGRGWVLTSQPLQPLQPSGPIQMPNANHVYAQVSAGNGYS